MNKNERKHQVFLLLTEIGIIEQLMTTEFNRRLPGGLLISHFGVLNHMCRLSDGKTPAELAAAFQVTKASMSNTLGKLQNRKLIKVQANPEDGRSKLVFLTKKGRDKREEAIEQLDTVFDRFDRGLDLENIVKTLPQIQELREFIDNSRDV